MSVKKIPYDMVAEQSVLGSMMLSNNAVDKACEKLFPESFYVEKHKIIFKALVDLYNKKTPIDMTTITSELTTTNKINDIGGVEYIADLLSMVPSAANIDYYIQIVEDNYLLRSVIDTSADISTLAYEHNGEVADILDQVENKIVNIIGKRRSSEYREIGEVLNSFQLNL